MLFSSSSLYTALLWEGLSSPRVVLAPCAKGSGSTLPSPCSVFLCYSEIANMVALLFKCNSLLPRNSSVHVCNRYLLPIVYWLFVMFAHGYEFDFGMKESSWEKFKRICDRVASHNDIICCSTADALLPRAV